MLLHIHSECDLTFDFDFSENCEVFDVYCFDLISYCCVSALSCGAIALIVYLLFQSFTPKSKLINILLYFVILLDVLR